LTLIDIEAHDIYILLSQLNMLINNIIECSI